MTGSRTWLRPSTQAELRAAADWIGEHAEHVYDAVAGTDPRRIGELVRAAGDRFPDVLPDREVRERDAGLAPGERLRIERDQAQLIRALLGNPATWPRVLADMRAPLPESAALARRLGSEGSLSLETVRVDLRSGVAEVTLCNTASLNAETNRLARDLESVVDAVSMSAAAEVGVLRGAPMQHRSYAGKRVFCAGINLKELAAGRISYLDFLIGREAGLLAKLLRGVRSPETGRSLIRPWIAVVDSFAIGGGMQLTLACDHVVAVDDAWLSLPAAKEGIVPGVANLRLPGRVGPRLARELILHGRRLSGAEALRAGLVDAVVPHAGVDEHLTAVVAALSEPAVAANKLMLSYGIEPEDEFAAYLGEFAVVQAERLHAADVRRKLPDTR